MKEIEGAVNFLIFSVLFWALTNYLMLSIALSDPGYIPRAPASQAPLGHYTVLTQGMGMASLKHCVTCSIMRPAGATHCTQCNSCVRRTDHHCTWLGACVGVRTYRTFLMLAFSLTAYTLLSLVAGLVFLNAVAQEEAGNPLVSLANIMNAMRISPLIWPLLLVNVLAVTGSGILLAYHLAYVVPRMTSTQELVKRDPDPETWVKHQPGDMLSFWRNLELVILSPRVPASLMGDMRTPVVF